MFSFFCNTLYLLFIIIIIGCMSLEALIERLEVVIRDNEAYIVAASAERAERNINAEIRQEQDAAFQETLRLDQERERQKLEAEEAKRREEEAEQARAQAEIERKENIARQKIELASEIPDEPPINEPEAVKIVIKLPEGQRLERRFHKCQSLKVCILKAEGSSSCSRTIYQNL